MIQQTAPFEVSTQSFMAEGLSALSRDELVAALSFMHRIVEADNRRDLQQLVTELHRSFLQNTDRPSLQHQGPKFDDMPAAASSKDGFAPHLFRYLHSCLVRAQARIDGVTVPTANCIKRSCPLSARELTVLSWMKEGKTNWEISRILGLSERTIRFHVGSIFSKLDVTSRTQAVARAMGTGLIAS